ncbi:MAG: PIN domain-containing protein [Bacillota bacterium]
MASSRVDHARDSDRRLLVLDTCVLVDNLRGHEPARVWLASMASRYDVSLSYSVITTAELLAGAKSDPSVEAVRRLLSMIRAIPVDERVAERAGLYLRKWRQSHGIGMPDALIAATAAEAKATLVTRDGAHFPMGDVTVLVPY